MPRGRMPSTKNSTARRQHWKLAVERVGRGSIASGTLYDFEAVEEAKSGAAGFSRKMNGMADRTRFSAPSCSPKRHPRLHQYLMTPVSETRPSAAAITNALSPTSRAHPLLLLLFVGSGCAALIYEIVWFQMLQLAIGSSAVSLGVLLGTFMGGMCAGSYGLSRVVKPDRHPLR